MVLPGEDVSREIRVGERRRVNLVRLARAQRTLLRLVLILIAIYTALPLILGSFSTAFWPAVWAGPLAFLGLVVAVLIIVQAVRLAIAAGDPPAGAVIAGLFMLVPLLGLLVVALIDGCASKLLRENGAKVGFLGVTAAEMHKLTVGYCHTCGYPIAGLTSNICPECGSEIGED